MQGRLLPPQAQRFQSFPREGWRKEFAFAAEAGLDAIEWIYDEYGEDVNPLATNDGVTEIKGLSQQSGIAVVSVCADYFMDRPLVSATGSELTTSVERLSWLLDRCRLAEIERVVLPFVDQSRIQDEDAMARVVDVIGSLLPKAEVHAVELHLETSLAPDAFARLLDRLPHPYLKVNYDSGNSASLGYNPLEEFRAYGERIGSVHIKDRLRGGGTVPLGRGDADLRAVFDGLEKLAYRGDFVLQVARGNVNDEVDWARRNRDQVQSLQRCEMSSTARTQP